MRHKISAASTIIAPQTSAVQPSYEQLVELLEATRLLAEERDLDRLLGSFAERCVKAIGAARCTIFLIDHQKQEIWSRLALGSEEIRFPLGVGLAGECIDKNRCIVIQDAYADSRFNPAIDRRTGFKTNNIIAVPLVNSEKAVIGCFQVINKTGEFTETDEILLLAFGGQASTAIETALLVTQKEEMISHLKSTQKELSLALSQLSAVYAIEKFASRTTSFSGLAQTTLENLLNAIDIDVAGIGLRLPNNTQQFYAMNHQKGFKESPFSDSNPDPTQKLKLFLSQMFQIEVHNFLQKPLITVDENGSQEIIGSIIIANKDGRFGSDDHKILDIIAGQVSSVCQRQHLQVQKALQDRMAMIGQVASTLVHDFRNPLSNIASIGSLVSMSDDLDPVEIKDYFRIINRETSRINNMLEELLDFARGKRQLKCDNVELNEFLQTIEESLRASAKQKGIEVVIEQKGSGSFYCDKDRLARVFFNIANNAFDAMKTAGTFKISALMDENQLVLRLTDTGPGIPPAIASRIFEAFVTYGKSNGTGLGMHIASEIITAHQGSIELDTEYKGGAGFIIKLPRPNPDQNKD